MGTAVAALTGTALYVATAFALVLLARRFVRPLTNTAALVLGLIPLSFTGRTMLTGRSYAPSDLLFLSEPFASWAGDFGVKPYNGFLGDVATLIVPLRHVARLAILRGEWPLWNPFCAAGDILAAQAQSAPYDPFFLLSLLLPEAISWTFLASTTFFVAALATFLFLREIDCDEWSSLVGAAAFALCNFLAVFLQWPVSPTNAVLPLVLLGVRRIVRSPGLSATGILTVAFVKLLLGGHPESALHIVAAGMLWAAGELWAVRFRGWSRSVPLAIAAGALAFLITAVFLLPFLDALPHTQEYQWRIAVLPTQVRSLPPILSLKKLAMQMVPFAGGEPHREIAFSPGFDVFGESAYIGSAGFALALLGFIRSRWRGRWMALAFIVAGLLLGTSSWPATDWIARVPLFTIGINERLVIMAAFGLAVLAALGCKAVIDEPERRGVWLPPLIAFAILALVAFTVLPYMRSRLTAPYIELKFVHLLLPPLLVIAALGLRRRRVWLGLALVAVIAGQRAIEMGTFYPSMPASKFYPSIPIVERLPRGGEPYRVAALGQMFTAQLPTMYGLEDVRMYTGMTLDRYDRYLSLWSVRQLVWYNHVDDLTAPYLSLLNVRYAFAPGTAAVPNGWSRIAANRNTQLLENGRVLPRAFLPRNVLLANDPDTSFGAYTSVETDFGERSGIAVEGEIPREERNGTGSLTIETPQLGTRILHARLNANAWAVVSESAWPGWRAYVDGKPTKVRIANGMLLALHLPAGEHTVRLVYRPPSFVVGRTISGMTLLTIAVAGFGRGLRARRRRLMAGADVGH